MTVNAGRVWPGFIPFGADTPELAPRVLYPMFRTTPSLPMSTYTSSKAIG
jgi:hypothetical protein